ncbi:uncharacterized protein LOC121973278 isoform X3 [Zingiber officinale]|uniref:uncharacterized protein LOC121973278 isoform X3 n=1 Tax=Zingiber officinale TaxID=94328 RepID=UPI001C4DD09E|nr:uncharacterized protein LOC121973278 isoform X3 [Zingiber officinale]XP_042380743.1 uncharacterized protein LOC121973278 isoform X3 [Zingiber officinale]
MFKEEKEESSSSCHRDLSELGMGMVQRPPGLNREEIEVRKADIRHKRGMDRFNERLAIECWSKCLCRLEHISCVAWSKCHLIFF